MTGILGDKKEKKNNEKKKIIRQHFADIDIFEQRQYLKITRDQRHENSQKWKFNKD